MTKKEYKKLCAEALNRKRHIIYDNDGSDELYYMRSPNLEELLECQSYPLRHCSDAIDTLFYTSTSSGFSQFTHNTKVGSVFTSTKGRFSNNQTEKILAKGTDVLSFLSSYCRNKEIEFFWSIRMNDTHDGGDAEDNSLLRFETNRFKNEHPECLLGAEVRPKHGRWTAVNFMKKKVHETFLAFTREVLENYEVDGINLDFFRHPVFFPSTARGEICTQEEINAMTDLVRNVRVLTEEIGMRKERPILLSVRVPDSVEFSKAIGLDIEGWMADSLVDMAIFTSYLRFNQWEYSANLAHKYGVLAYASLDEIRISEPEAKCGRMTPESYYARAMDALSAGMDGVFLFNFSDSRLHIPKDKKESNIKRSKEVYVQIFNNIASLSKLQSCNKTYYLSERGIGGVAGGTLPHRAYIKIPVLTPWDGQILIGGETTVCLDFHIGEDLSGRNGNKPNISISLRFSNSTMRLSDKIAVSLNGKKLKKIGIDEDTLHWAIFSVDSDNLICGINQLEVSNTGSKEIALFDIKADIIYQ